MSVSLFLFTACLNTWRTTISMSYRRGWHCLSLFGYLGMGPLNENDCGIEQHAVARDKGVCASGDADYRRKWTTTLAVPRCRQDPNTTTTT